MAKWNVKNSKRESYLRQTRGLNSSHLNKDYNSSPYSNEIIIKWTYVMQFISSFANIKR